MNKDFDLTGKVALITGGNGGIGLGMAEALARAGADIVIWGTNAAKTSDAVQKISSYGVRAVGNQVDVSDDAAVRRAMDEAVEDMGRVDCVIANAGIREEGKFVDYGNEAYRRTVAVNLDGVFFTLRAVCSHMKQRAESGDPGGSLLVVSSVSTIHGAARNQAYSATKGALAPLVNAIAVEHARHGIRANTLLPGWFATEMTLGDRDNEAFTSNVLARVPMRRWGTPEDLGGIVVYFCANASRFHTGDCVRIDGGYALS